MTKTFLDLIKIKEQKGERLEAIVKHRMELEAVAENGDLPLKLHKCDIKIGAEWETKTEWGSNIHTKYLKNTLHDAMLRAIIEEYPHILARTIQIIRDEYVQACKDCQDGAVELLGEIATSRKGSENA